jgi:hypothetical protein
VYVSEVRGAVSLPVEDLQALKGYIQLGPSMLEDESVKSIVKWIQDTTLVHRETYSQWVFMFLEGSSGRGKTQLVFTIMLSMLGRRLPHAVIKTTLESSQCESGLLIYIPFVAPNIISQPIYKNFMSISALFNNCLKQDRLQKLTLAITTLLRRL